MGRLSQCLGLTALIFLLWAILVATVGWVRPLYYSTEEMHYASIAWEMWQHHHFILPIQGGVPYAEKGPLLFWLNQLGWWLFGVSSTWSRLMPALFGLATLYLMRPFLLRLWPSETAVANIAPLILVGSYFFAAKIPVARFDVMTTFFVVYTLYQLIKAVEVHWRYWFLFSLGMALGLLTKGPVLFLFVLPAAITARIWATPKEPWRFTYGWMLGAILLGIGLVGIWLAAAVWQGGFDYANALLFHRSVARIWHTQQYWRQNWAYYFYTFAFMLLPWLIWPPFWQALRRFLREIKQQPIDKRLRFLAIVIGCAFVFLTLTAEKAPRYILPALPFAAMLLSYIIVKYMPAIHRSAQWLIAVSYLIIGLIYALLPQAASPSMHAKYPWLINISPIWGIGIMGIGAFWLLWRSADFKAIALGLAVSTVLFWSCYHFGVTRAQAVYGDWRSLALQVADLQRSGYPVAFAGSYQELEFFGRLSEPLTPLTKKDMIVEWSRQHPNGWIVVRDYHISPMQLRLVSAQTVEEGASQ
jgi:4-amino-4-deoxy-L-arabinose transferase-like glycosyltransferase